jgi:hypothetical protein
MDKQVTREAIRKHIKEIDRKYQSTEPWLHPTLSRLTRELLLGQANKQFKAGSSLHDFCRHPRRMYP